MTTKLFHSCSGYSQHIKQNRTDDKYILRKQPKNIPINQLRRDLFFTNNNWCKDKGKLIKLYTDHKQDTLLKEKNTQLHKLFYKSKTLFLYKILEMFDAVDFIQIPNCFKIKINNARFVWYNSNQKCLIGETDDEYYIYFYSGS